MRQVNFDPPDWLASLQNGFVRAVSCDALSAIEVSQSAPVELAEQIEAAAFEATRNGCEAFVLIQVTPAYEDRLREFQARDRRTLAR